MSDSPIYFVPGNILKWGERIYYYNCHRDGGDYAWFKNNLEQAKGSPNAKDINADWVFKGAWKPQLSSTKKIKKRS
jgi:pectinesterase